MILLTDGKPEWWQSPTETETEAYIARLRTVAGRFAARGIPLFVILAAGGAARHSPGGAAQRAGVAGAGAVD
ncbi:MAG: hypothetical protein Kow0031_25050 [Anaerolineae bacterium]